MQRPLSHKTTCLFCSQHYSSDLWSGKGSNICRKKNVENLWFWRNSLVNVFFLRLCTTSACSSISVGKKKVRVFSTIHSCNGEVTKGGIFCFGFTHPPDHFLYKMGSPWYISQTGGCFTRFSLQRSGWWKLTLSVLGICDSCWSLKLWPTHKTFKKTWSKNRRQKTGPLKS